MVEPSVDQSRNYESAGTKFWVLRSCEDGYSAESWSYQPRDGVNCRDRGLEIWQRSGKDPRELIEDVERRLADGMTGIGGRSGRTGFYE